MEIEKDEQSGRSYQQAQNEKQESDSSSYHNTRKSSTTTTTVLRTSAKTTTTTTGSKLDDPRSTTITTTTSTTTTNNNNNKMGQDQGDHQISLADKLRNHYNASPKGSKASKFAYALFQFQSLSALYMVLTHMIPYLLQDYGEMTQYYCKIFFCYMFAMSEANWWCAILYKSDLPDVRDKPTSDDDDWFQRPPETLKNAETIEPKLDRFGFEWKYCKPCNRYKPPRAHHCAVCKKCILRRDHHCYFVGRCIGHYNQRYFVVLTCYGIIIPLVFIPLTIPYLLSFEDATWWGDYFLPSTLLNFFYYQSVSWQFALTTFQFYSWFLFLLWGGFYFTVQLSLIMEGKTLVELAKKFDMKVTSTWTERIGMVFGDYWLLNFLFPAQIIFKQRHDGVHYENIKFLGKSEDATK